MSGIISAVHVELEEEAGIPSHNINAISPVGLCIDFRHMVIDVVLEVSLINMTHVVRSVEHSSLYWVDNEDLPPLASSLSESSAAHLRMSSLSRLS